MDCSLPGPSVHGDSPRKDTGVGGHSLFQEIFPTQGYNTGLPHCRRILDWDTRQMIMKGPLGSALCGSWVILNIHLSPEHCKADSGPSASVKSTYKEQTEDLWEKFYRLKVFKMKERNMKMILSVGLLCCANFTPPSSGWCGLDLNLIYLFHHLTNI